MIDASTRLLVIDTSLESVVVALVNAEGTVLAYQEAPVRPGKAEAVVSLLALLEAETENLFSSLERVVVVIGPGSFTGVRIGVAAARALGVAFDLPVVGVSTFEAYAAPFLKRNIAIAVALEAREDHVFFQTFESSGRVRRMPALVPTRVAIQALAAEGAVILTGNIREDVMATVRREGVRVEAFHTQTALDISDVARVGARLDPAVSPPEPIYLHAPPLQKATEASLSVS